MSTGIYKIENVITGDFYIGSSVKSIETRWKYHIRDLKANKHHSSRLQNSWNKHGSSSFEFKILTECDPDICIIKEQFLIDTLEPEFNMNPTAGNCSGRKFSEESKKKMSESAKKRGVHPSFLLNHIKTGRSPRKNRKSRAIPGARKLYAVKRSLGIVVGKNEIGESIQFESTREASRFFRSRGTTFNHCMLNNVINIDRMYYGYYWTRECLK